MPGLKTRRSDDLRMPIILAGAAVAAIILLIILLMPKNDSSTEIASLSERLRVAEEKLATLDERNFEMNQQISELKQTVGIFSQEAERLQAIPVEIENMEKKIEFIDKRQGSIEKKIAEAASTDGAKTASKTIKRKVVPKKEADAEDKPALTGSRYHTVFDGETLYSIANKYDMTVEKLRELNDLKPESLIYPGQRLVVAK